VSLSISQVFEAKYKQGRSAAPASGNSNAWQEKKIRLLSLPNSRRSTTISNERVYQTQWICNGPFSHCHCGLISFRFDWDSITRLFDAPSISDKRALQAVLGAGECDAESRQGGANLGFLKKLAIWATGEAPPAKN